MLDNIVLGFVVMEALLLIVVCIRGSRQRGKKNMKNSVTGAWNRYAFMKQMKDFFKKGNVLAVIVKFSDLNVYYQPIWDRKHGNIHSAEALIRLKDEELGFISPEEFIPIAERNGTIFDIGLFVFEEACRFYKEKDLQAQGIDYIEVNLSVIQCMDSKIVQNFNEILSEKDLEACHINLEITESAVTDNQGILKRTVRALDHMGIRFSLDDYGTGYSNISFMYDLPFTIIKIDKSILWKALHPQLGQGDYRARIMLEKTVTMLQEMKYQILVEGVETEEQKELLEKMRCDYLQGYFFSKPLPADDFMDYLQTVNV